MLETTTKISLDEDRLIRAIDAKIRPLLIDEGYLDSAEEGYQHKKVIPRAQPHLSLESLQQDAVKGVTSAIAACVNLLSMYDAMPATKFIESRPAAEVRDKTIELLYGTGPLAARIAAFHDWSRPGPAEPEQSRMGINATVISYLLAVSAPEKYAFCKPSVYNGAAKALLGEGGVEHDQVRRVVHCTEFYGAALEVMQAQPDMDRLTDLMHTHIAFYLMNKPPFPTWEQLDEWEPEEGEFYSADDFVRAFRELEPEISSNQRTMLAAHYTAPDRTSTATRLAQAAGYANYGGANAQYGRLAARVGEVLGHNFGESEKIMLLVEFMGRGGDDDHYQLRMRAEVAEALEILGWVQIEAWTLEFVETPGQFQDNVRTFQTDLDGDLVESGEYWVYDTISGWIAPCKFAAYKDMTPLRYQRTLRTRPKPAIFHGSKARDRAQAILASPASSSECPAGHRLLEGAGVQGTLFAAGPERDREQSVLDRFVAELSDEKMMRRGNMEGGERSLDKPTMLLAAMVADARGMEKSWINLRQLFLEIYSVLGLGTGKPEEPYPRLRNRGPEPDGPFWDILAANGQPAAVKDDVASAQEGTSVRWTGYRGECAADKRLRPLLIQALLEYYDEKHRTALAAKFPELAAAIVSPDGAEASRAVTGLHNYWVLQGNPQFFRVTDAVADLNELTWIIKDHKGKVNVGDTAFIWRCGPEAALLATVTVTSLPAVIPDDRPSARYIVPQKSDKAETDLASSQKSRVWIKMEHRLDPPIDRQTLLAHPILSKVQAFTRAQGSNFLLKPEEGKALLDFITESQPEPVAPDPAKPQESYSAPSLAEIAERIRAKGYRISLDLLSRYHLSLKTRGFVILSGVSGTGKTWLARCYAEAIGARHELVSVAPNWTTNEDLLGYLNPMDGHYHDTTFSRFLRAASAAYQAAQKHQVVPQPFHLILDEMNLARVEYYFAKFLSVMEIRATDGSATLELAPSDLVVLPPNLRFIGTVNIDETTKAFSDKVYDRAQLLELEASEAEIREHLEVAPYAGLLLQIWSALREAAPFAYRVVDEIRDYVDRAASHGISWETALDHQMLQKLLPKVKGADPRVGEALSRFVELVRDRYPMSQARAERMLGQYQRSGFTSYF